MYPFEVGSKIVVAATSGGGKTSWAVKLIKFRMEMFPEEPPEKIMIVILFFRTYIEIYKKKFLKLFLSMVYQQRMILWN